MKCLILATKTTVIIESLPQAEAGSMKLRCGNISFRVFVNRVLPPDSEFSMQLNDIQSFSEERKATGCDSY